MTFHESATFPTGLSYGTAGGPGYAVDILRLDGGAEVRIARWSQAKNRYEVRYAVKSLATLRTLQAFYRARQGPLFGFRFSDPLDKSTAADHVSAPAWDDVELGTGDGAEVAFQLRKVYEDGGVTEARSLAKPVPGSVVVGWGGASKTEGVDWSVDTATGIVTLASAAGAGVVVYGGCLFDVPVRFDHAADDVLAATVQDFDIGEAGIPLVEISVPEVACYQLVPGGGAREIPAVGAAGTYAYSHNLGQGFLVYAAPGTGETFNITLPSVTSGFPLGGPYFAVINAGAGSVVLKAAGGATIKTVAAGTGAELFIRFDGSVREFVAF